MLKEEEDLRRSRMKDLAIAVRFSRADKKSFMNFISQPADGKPKGISGYQYFKSRKGKSGIKKRKS
jgi:hypothetical protein